jgi:putative nucleotidyltransferase with HDIG domain
VLSSEALNQLWKSFGVLDTLITAIDNRDRYTRRHSEQVMNYALLIAQEMELSPEMLDAVRTCGLLHDVGKVAVPDAILRKPGRLSQDETRLMQQHTEFGAMIIRNVPHLDRVLEGVRSHHEAFDGSGYPDALTGDTIPLMGRLLAVPVCFSAMTTDRPYRKALSTSQALEEIAAGRGTQFDPDVVDAFLRAMSTPAHMAPSTTSPALDSIPEVAAGAAAR